MGVVVHPFVVKLQFVYVVVCCGERTEGDRELATSNNRCMCEYRSVHTGTIRVHSLAYIVIRQLPNVGEVKCFLLIPVIESVSFLNLTNPDKLTTFST